MKVSAIESSLIPYTNSEDLSYIALYTTLKETLKTILATPFIEPSFEFATSDVLKFGFAWDYFRTIPHDELMACIQERKEELQLQIDEWRYLISHKRQSLESRANYAEIRRLWRQEPLQPLDGGAGGAYLLKDAADNPRYIVKPVDEDIYCINNRKGMGTPFDDYSVRAYIPLYRSTQNETFAYELARLTGLDSITPLTLMDLVENNQFYDVNSIPQKREKFCSVQRFVPESKDLFDHYHECFEKNLSDAEILSQFDLEDFEKVNLFLWLTYDCDAHGGNFRVYLKPNGKQGIQKIDNGLTFPEENFGYRNTLSWLESSQIISESLREKIRQIPLSLIEIKMHEYRLNSSIFAFRERVEVLQKLIERPDLSIHELDLRMRALSLKNGKEVALNEPLTKIEELLYPSSDSKRTTSSSSTCSKSR